MDASESFTGALQSPSLRPNLAQRSRVLWSVASPADVTVVLIAIWTARDGRRQVLLVLDFATAGVDFEDRVGRLPLTPARVWRLGALTPRGHGSVMSVVTVCTTRLASCETQ